ncbi:MAG TPA: PAS domain S-box protein [Gemmatimonadaceae bacterium]
MDSRRFELPESPIGDHHGSQQPGQSLDAPRPVILDSWRRSAAYGIQPDAQPLAVRRVAPHEMARRLLENAELIERARPHLEWLSAMHAAAPHIVTLVDDDGIVLASTGADAEALEAAQLAPGCDWSEASVGTNALGTSLIAGTATTVSGREHVVQALHGSTSAAAPLRSPAGELVGALAIRSDDVHAPSERLLTVAYAAYAIEQELRYHDGQRRVSRQLDAERRLVEERARQVAAVNALVESEAYFRGAFEHAPIGKAISTPDGRWTRVNRALCEIVGYREDELIGGTFQSITHPEDLARDLELRQRVLAGELDSCRIEKRLLHKQGHAVWVELHAMAVRDTTGAPLYVINQFQDITERRRAEEALRESEARYERIAADVPGVVYQFVYRADGTKGYTFVSEGARAMFGIDPAEVLRDSSVMLDLIHPEERAEFYERARRVAVTLEPFLWEGRVLLPSGEERLIQVAARDQRLPDGSVTSDGLVTDVTELRRATQQLEESEQRYRSLFEHHPDAVFSIDPDGCFRTANPACETISGYALDELNGAPFAPLIAPEHLESAFEHFRAALSGEAQRYEITIRHKSGRRVEIDVTNIPMVVGGAVVGVFGIARDLTTRRALEAQLRQAQRMEAVGQLAGGIAHDFNNILAAINGFGELLRESLAPDDPHQADVAEILKGTRRAAALTKQLLAFSRKQVLQPAVIDLNHVIAEMVTMLRPLLGAAIHLVTHPAPSAVPVFADRTQIEQVLMNLALNARDAMPSGGALTIATSLAPGKAGSRPSAVLTVSDQGIGMSPEVAARAFEPFFTTKPPGRGTGLGLATVHGIVQQSGGAIDVTSREGAGTTFTITLPTVDAKASIAQPAAAAHASRGTGTVLLVDDEDAVRAIARRILERAGYRVLTARHGADALRVLSEADTRIDVLLSDVVMPELGGVELAGRAVEHTPELRVVLMSGYTNDTAILDELGSLAGFLAKPFTADTLLRSVQEAMQRA